MIDVVFRTFKHTGEVIAIFPFIEGDMSPSTCLSYMRVGQHGACDPQHIVEVTTLSTVAEYSFLLAELGAIGYEDLVIRKKVSPKAYADRAKRLVYCSRR